MALEAKRQSITKHKHNVSHFYFSVCPKIAFRTYFVCSQTFSYKSKVQQTPTVWAACDYIIRIWQQDLCEMNKGHKLWKNLENLLRQNTSHNCYHSISVITPCARYLVRQPDVCLLSRNNWVTGNLTLIYLVVMATKKAHSSTRAVVTRKINEISP